VTKQKGDFGMKRTTRAVDRVTWRDADRRAGRAAAGAIELPDDLVLRQSKVIERVLEEALDILDLRVVCIRVRETRQA
jgi:hypothetical protein